MNAEKTQELIQNYLDFSLTHEQKVQLERHLDSNSSDRADLARYKLILEALEQEEQIDPPADFTGKVMARLPDIEFRADMAKGFGSGFEKAPWKKLALGVASVLVASVCTWKLLSPSPVSPDSINANRPVEVVAVKSPELKRSPGASLPQETPKQELAFDLTLQVTEGVVLLTHTDGETRHVRKGEPVGIRFRDEIETGLHARAEILYQNGDVRLSVRPRTKLQVAQNSLRLYHGDSWVNVVRKGTHFEVQTPNLVAAVRGTIFSASVRYSTGNIQKQLTHNLFSGSLGQLDAAELANQSMVSGLGVFNQTRELKLSDPVLKSSEVNVFEGAVFVSSLSDSNSSALLKEGDRVQSSYRSLEAVGSIEQATYVRWQKDLAVSGVSIPESVAIAQKEGLLGSDAVELNHEIRPENSFEQELDPKH